MAAAELSLAKLLLRLSSRVATGTCMSTASISGSAGGGVVVNNKRCRRRIQNSRNFVDGAARSRSLSVTHSLSLSLSLFADFCRTALAKRQRRRQRRCPQQRRRRRQLGLGLVVCLNPARLCVLPACCLGLDTFSARRRCQPRTR